MVSVGVYFLVGAREGRLIGLETPERISNVTFILHVSLSFILSIYQAFAHFFLSSWAISAEIFVAMGATTYALPRQWEV